MELIIQCLLYYMSVWVVYLGKEELTLKYNGIYCEI